MDIKLNLERLEGNRAFLKDEKGRLIIWPRDFLPENAEAGKTITLNSNNEKIATSDNQLAKDILNEIFLS